ncbi:hypothetical protein HYPSUDRAFT_76101 [Hypholoma sublateritium FD-334 SS-4]|uniref:Uncharacterized protein n=1 Tax=Hypholoma sublateritium (strain FD-334 SS-4) TaxID=945553 RepID=A0A0D2P9T9_HYPSF|nr:hypothetical protein HYPSUDRAFT_76101 [Hypholoma sublateritium FD-334 SS-4]
MPPAQPPPDDARRYDPPQPPPVSIVLSRREPQNDRYPAPPIFRAAPRPAARRESAPRAWTDAQPAAATAAAASASNAPRSTDSAGALEAAVRPHAARPRTPPPLAHLLQPPLDHPAPAADNRAAAAPTRDAPGAYHPARPAPSQRSAGAGRRTRASHSGLPSSSTRYASMRGRHGWLARCTRAAGGGPRRRDDSATDDGDGGIARLGSQPPMAVAIPVLIPAPVSNRPAVPAHPRLLPAIPPFPIAEVPPQLHVRADAGPPRGGFAPRPLRVVYRVEASASGSSESVNASSAESVRRREGPSW